MVCRESLLRLGAYEVVREIGRGGMGVVFEARTDDGRTVALKVLKSARPGAAARFDRERRLLSTLGEAEGFVPLLDAGVGPGGEPFLVMPYLADGTVRDRIRRGPLGIEETVAIATAVAGALARAHERGIVHRDVKPENLLFGSDGRVLVADLGVAKHFRFDAPGGSGSVSLSKTGEALGTLGYMPPEQLTGEVSPAVDVFALGATLHECLTGRPAFPGDTPLEVSISVARGAADSVAARRPDAPPWLVLVLERALASDLRRRFPDGRAFKLALAGRRSGESRRGLRLGLAALAVAAVAVALTVALGSARRDPEPVPAPRPPTQIPPRPALPAAPAFPRECASFLGSRRTKLTAVLGSYAGRGEGMIFSVAASPDDRLAVTASMGGVAVFDLHDLGRVARLASTQTEFCAFSPDGKRIFAATSTGELRLWDATTREPVTAIQAQPHLKSAALCAAGGRAVSSGDRTIELWDLESGRELARVDAAGGLIAASADGHLVLEATAEGPVLHDLDARSARALGVGEPGARVICVALSPDGKRALAGGADHLIRLYEVESGRLLGIVGSHNDMIRQLAFSPDGHRALSASSDRTVAAWDLDERRELASFVGHASWVSACAFTHDGKRALSGSADATLRLWDLATGSEVHETSGHANGVTSVVASADERVAFSAGGDGTVRAWDLATGTEVRALRGARSTFLESIALSTDGARLLSGGGLGKNSGTIGGVTLGELLLWDVASGAVLARPEGHSSMVNAVALSADGKLALSGGEGKSGPGALRLWAVEGDSLRLLGELAGHADSILSVVFLPGGRAASSAIDMTVKVWDLGTRQCRSYPVDALTLTLAVSPDGRELVGSSFDGTLMVLDLEARDAAPRILPGPAGKLLSVAFLDATEVVVTTAEGAIVLYDVATATEVDRFELSSAEDSGRCVCPLPGKRAFLVGTARSPILRFDLVR
jgi:WD40 repeat protein